MPLGPPPPTPTATVNAGAGVSADAILAQLTQQSSVIGVITVGQATIQTEGGPPGSVETLWTATVTQVAVQRGKLITVPYGDAHTIYLLYHDSHDGDMGARVDNGPQFKPGERDVVFLVATNTNFQPCYELAGGSLGRFLISSTRGTIAASRASDPISRYNGETPAQLFAQLPH